MMSKSKSIVKGVVDGPEVVDLTLRRKLDGKDFLLGAIVSEYLRPSLAKLYSYAGFDFIFLEGEHGLFNSPDLAHFVTAARDNGIPVISKVGELNRTEIIRRLDAGIIGIQLPRTESAADVAQLVDYVKYPPIGSRPGAPCFGHVDYKVIENHGAWLETANKATLTIAMIETAKGYEKAEEIISSPHLDMLFIGIYDLSITLGHPGQYDHPQVKKATEEILELCNKYSVPFGTEVSGVESARALAAKGCRFTFISDEIEFIRDGATSAVQEYRQLASH